MRSAPCPYSLQVSPQEKLAGIDIEPQNLGSATCLQALTLNARRVDGRSHTSLRAVRRHRSVLFSADILRFDQLMLYSFIVLCHFRRPPSVFGLLARRLLSFPRLLAHLSFAVSCLA